MSNKIKATVVDGGEKAKPVNPYDKDKFRIAYVDFEALNPALPLIPPRPDLEGHEITICEAWQVNISSGWTPATEVDYRRWDNNFNNFAKFWGEDRTRKIYQLVEAEKEGRQPFERFPALADILLHAANHWKVDGGSNWNKLLYEINKICTLYSELEQVTDKVEDLQILLNAERAAKIKPTTPIAKGSEESAEEVFNAIELGQKEHLYLLSKVNQDANMENHDGYFDYQTAAESCDAVNKLRELFNWQKQQSKDEVVAIIQGEMKRLDATRRVDENIYTTQKRLAVTEYLTNLLQKIKTK